MSLAPGTKVDPEFLQRLRGIRAVVFDFDGVFTDNTVLVLEDGREAVRCWRGDGLGLDKLRRRDIAMTVLSTETNPVVTARCRKLRLPCIQGCDDKLTALKTLMTEQNLEVDAVAYVGNDINDAACLDFVGMPMVPADAHEEVLALAAYRTRAYGGRGAVREVCDLLDQAMAGQ